MADNDDKKTSAPPDATPDATKVLTRADAPATQMRGSSGSDATLVGSTLQAGNVARTSEAESSAPADATLVRPSEPVQTQVAANSIARAPSTHDEANSESHPLLAKSGQDVTFDIGSVIRDRFVLESLLGKGGMGIVFSALDRRKEEARDPNPHVAIKILSADFRRHPDSLIALQREARKAQTLAHPNVVTVFDFDRDGSSVYMTMERLRGRSLDGIVRDARGRGIGREAALPIIRGIAEGLAYAHRKGIVHSDLKPGNVFVLEDGTPKILDFGIARAVPNAAAAEKDTFDAGSLGAYTEAYATLEMIDGINPHPADDVYALGLIAYELLTGSHPYNRMSAFKARAQNIKPPMPKGLKRREWRVLEGAISVERSARPQDAAEFLKGFFGVTKLQKSLLAAVAALLVLSGFLWYRNYSASGPAIPFEQLPVATQTQFRSLMESGDREFEFFVKDNNVMALSSAIDQYADAYRLHPRNRAAVRALERSADAFLRAAEGDTAKQQAIADVLAEKSEHLAKYPPVVALKP